MASILVVAAQREDAARSAARVAARVQLSQPCTAQLLASTAACCYNAHWCTPSPHSTQTNGVKIFYDPRHATHSNAKGHPRRRAASTTAEGHSNGPTRRGSTSNKRGPTPRILYDAALGGAYFTSKKSVEILPNGKNATSRRHLRETGIACKRCCGPSRCGSTPWTTLLSKINWRSRSRGRRATTSRHVADGFCLYNFAAGAAAYALDVLGKDWVALLDFGVHPATV